METLETISMGRSALRFFAQLGKLGLTAATSLSFVLVLSGVTGAAQASARVGATGVRVAVAPPATQSGPTRPPQSDGFIGVTTIEIDDVSNDEGNAGKTSFDFLVMLDPPASSTVTVDFATADGSATVANDDYQPTSGTLTFEPGVTSQTVSVSVNGDTKLEDDETFFVNLSNASLGAVILDGEGVGKIGNDDQVPSLSIDDVTMDEGDSGTTKFVFTVSLSNLTDQPVTVDYGTSDGSATVADNDYEETSGTLTIPPKTAVGKISIAVFGDNIVEDDESFFIKLFNPDGATIADGEGMATIVNDDGSLSIGDVVDSEGDAGTTKFVFTVQLSHPVKQDVTVNFATADGSATLQNHDYQATSGTLTIPSKTASGTITVLVNGDHAHEDNESFFVNLSDPVNTTILDGQAIGFILNDDGPVTVPAAGTAEFAIGSVRPNPSRGMTLMEVTVAREARVRLSVVDVQGREVATLIDGVYRPGRYQVTWNGKSGSTEVPAGLYFVRYRVPGKEMVRRLVLAR